MGFDMGIGEALALGSTAVGVGSKVLGGMNASSGAMISGQATSASDMFQSMVAMHNAQIEEDNARRAMQAGEQNAYNEGMKNRIEMGNLTSNQAASGVDLGSKSFVQTRQSVENAGLQNQQNIEQGAAYQSYAHQQNAASLRAQAIMDQLGAQESMMGAKISSNSSLLDSVAGAVGGVASAYPNIGGGLGGGSSGSSGNNPSELSPGYELNY